MIRILAVAAIILAASAAYAAAPLAAQLRARLADAPDADVAAVAPSASPREPLSWEGFVKVGVADRFAHTLETEPLVAPLARVGFVVEIPEGTTSILFEMEWPEGVPMHFMAHGPHEAGMPTFMTDWPDSGAGCLAVPEELVTPGHWRMMGHVEDAAREIAFTIQVITTGTEDARILPGDHGHEVADGMPMDLEEPAPCGEDEA